MALRPMHPPREESPEQQHEQPGREPSWLILIALGAAFVLLAVGNGLKHRGMRAAFQLEFGVFWCIAALVVKRRLNNRIRRQVAGIALAVVVITACVAAYTGSWP